jgi:hypothetical protein
MCYHSNSDDNTNNNNNNSPCWNGTAEGVYSAAVVEDGFESQA